MRPGRGTHPAGTGLQPTTVHAICAGGCALARGCLYDLALTDVETRDAIIAMASDLLIGSAVTAGSLTGLLWGYAYPTISAVGIERRGKHHQV